MLRLSADGKTSLVPIAILVDGKFWDAGSYKASPVPMALEPGTVYEAERTGSSQGLFTIGAALHSNAANAAVPWLATGTYVLAGSDTGKKELHAEKTPVGIDNSDAPPRLSKNPGASTSTPPASTPSSTPSGGNAPAPSSAPSSSSPSSSSGGQPGDEPPRLSRPASSPTPSGSTPDSSSTPASTPTPQGQSPANQAPSGQSAPSPNTSSPNGGGKSDTANSGGKPDDQANVPASDSGAGGSNRPRLRRGKPATSFADEDIPGYSKAGPEAGVIASVKASANAAKAAPVKDSGPVQLIPAISDSAGPEPRSYAFEWIAGDEPDRRKQLVSIAQEKVRAYLQAQAKATVAPKPSAATSPRRASAKKTLEPVLNNVQMTAYDLWSSNQPIVIFSADAQMPTAAHAAQSTASSSSSAMPQASSPTASSGSSSSNSSSNGASSATSSAGSSPGTPDALRYSVLIVAYPDIYNNIHTLYVGVTDKFHLDITPRLELVDAVDADGDGRGELLFRETSDIGTGWVIYRASADKLWKLFDSLNPE